MKTNTLKYTVVKSFREKGITYRDYSLLPEGIKFEFK